MPALVLLPGLDGTGLLFRDLIAALGPAWRAIVVSYPPDRALGYEELEAHVRGFLPVDEPYWLLAESFSGPIGISIAASRPTHLQGLILCCTFARNPLPWLAFARPLIGIAPVRLLPLRLLSYFVLGRFATAAHREALREALRKVSPAALRARARAALSVDVSAKLTHIAVPTLYLQASGDHVIPAVCGEAIASLLPGLKLTSLHAPHFLLQTVPGQAAALLHEWSAHSGVEAAHSTSHSRAGGDPGPVQTSLN